MDYLSEKIIEYQILFIERGYSIKIFCIHTEK